MIDMRQYKLMLSGRLGIRRCSGGYMGIISRIMDSSECHGTIVTTMG